MVHASSVGDSPRRAAERRSVIRTARNQVAFGRALLALLAICTGGCRPDRPGEVDGSGPAPAAATEGSGARPRPDPWLDAQSRGVDFRAVGQEPGWFVEIDHEGALHLVYDYGDRTATTPASLPVTSGAMTMYVVKTESQHIAVSAEERGCEDVMSGEPFPLTVTVSVGGRELHGCGRMLRR
jgi:uncharacterized membrane protein